MSKSLCNPWLAMTTLAALGLLVVTGCRQQQTASGDSPFFPQGTASTAVHAGTTEEPASETKSGAATEATASSDPAPEATVAPAPIGKLAAPAQEQIDATRKAGTRRAVISTARGDIVVELYGADAPLTVANFINLVNAKFYDGLNFHRVESNPGFSLIQGGCPKGDGSGGPGYQIKLEISPKLRHVEGALAMARSAEPDSAGSQFYICWEEIEQLNDNYAVFGKVVKGLENAKKISVGDKITKIVLE